LDALGFLRLVLPPEGPNNWYVGFAARKSTTPGGPAVRRQWSFQRIESLHAWLIRFDNEGFEVYYACASFKQEKTWDAREQRWRRRCHDNVNLICDLWADIDTQESKPNAVYIDREEASHAVVKFCRDARLPLPLWVGSGGGLHVHWPLATCLGMAEWLPYARGLKLLAQNHGLKIDPARTADASSILRPPGFLHRGTGRRVQASEETQKHDLSVFEHLKKAGENESGTGLRRTVTRSSGSDSPLTRAMLGSTGDNPSDARAIAHYCRQIRQLALDPGKPPESVHYGAAGLFHWCGPGGTEFYHSLISPDFHRLADQKREHWIAAERGPPTCNGWFAAKNPDGCEGCPFKERDSSPIQIGRLAETELRQIFGRPTDAVDAASGGGDRSFSESGPQTTELGTQSVNSIFDKAPEGINGFPSLKNPWFLNSQSQIVYISEANKGEPVETVVSEHPIYIDSIHVSEGTKRSSYTFKHFLPKEGTWTTINVPAADMANGHGVPELLAKRVVVRHEALFRQYMNEQVGEFGRSKMALHKYEQFGWKHEDREFLFGTKLYSPEGIRDVVLTDSLGHRAGMGIGPARGGEVRAFVSLLNQLFRPDHYCAWFNLFAGFGTPFQRWHSSTEGGMLLSNYTADSAKGKTKILNATAAIWGQWNALKIKHYDTASSKGLMLAELANLPGFFDEIAHFVTDPKHGPTLLREFLDMLSAGTDRQRALGHGVGIRPQLGMWQLLVQASTNRPIVDILEVFMAAETAPIRRLFECDATPPNAFDPMLGEHLEKALWANAGHAGDAFLAHLMRNLDPAKEALPLFTDAIWRRYKMATEHRFRVRLLGNIKLAALLAHDCGLVPRDVNVDEVIAWGVDQISVRTPAVTQTITLGLSSEALHEFLAENANNTLRVQFAYKPGIAQMPLGQKPQKLVVRTESHTGRAYATVRDFKRFLVLRGYPFADVVTQLKNNGLVEDTRKMTLGAGTEYNGVAVDCIAINITHPSFMQTTGEVIHANFGTRHAPAQSAP
jgi:Domain of unknown function (DUF927)